MFLLFLLSRSYFSSGARGAIAVSTLLGLLPLFESLGGLNFQPVYVTFSSCVLRWRLFLSCFCLLAHVFCFSRSRGTIGVCALLGALVVPESLRGSNFQTVHVNAFSFMFHCPVLFLEYYLPLKKICAIRFVYHPLCFPCLNELVIPGAYRCTRRLIYAFAVTCVISFVICAH